MLLATTETVTKITYDSTITISIVLAICALFAPSITAIINNRHHFKIRKLELNHDERAHRADILYKNKYDIYKLFLERASSYFLFNNAKEYYINLLSSLQESLLLCDSETRPLLLDFQTKVKAYGKNDFENDAKDYLNLLTEISNAFNRELSMLSMEHDNKRK